MSPDKLLYFFLCVFLFAGCAQEEIDPGFAIETGNGVTLDCSMDSEALVSFTSTREWQAATESSWLSISPSSGDAGTHEITITATSDNTSGKVRTATVTLTSLTLTQEITIEQQSYYVELEQDEYSVSAEGEALEIRFTTNVDYDELAIYSSGENFLTQQAQTRSGDAYRVELTVLPNTNGRSRTAYILFYKETDQEQVLLNTATIVQEGVDSASSTDYSADKEVRVLQSATEGNGLSVVIMGDGFIDTEIADGTYDQVMEKAMENLFTEEPLKSLKAYFDVYSVTAVSKHNSFGTGYETAFGCELEGGNSTGISGNDEAVQEYVQCVEGIDLGETLAVVILNSSAYAGTTFFGYSDQQGQMAEFAIAYCPVIYDLENEYFRRVLVHEAVGHGFAKLEDEYSYEENTTIPSSEVKTVQYLQSFGWAQNVDFTTDTGEVLWSAFLNDDRYASEGLGIYEGACTYMKGVYRPTEESMMNNNTNGFNAPSRRAIYDMVMERGTGKEATYEEFVVFDRQVQAQTRNVVRVSVAEEDNKQPFARPRFANKVLGDKE